jgi:hypothetical protein
MALHGRPRLVGAAMIGLLGPRRPCAGCGRKTLRVIARPTGEQGDYCPVCEPSVRSRTGYSPFSRSPRHRVRTGLIRHRRDGRLHYYPNRGHFRRLPEPVKDLIVLVTDRLPRPLLHLLALPWRTGRALLRRVCRR